jgi:3-oxocholest-4-en-26-oate---CoA ligase
MRFNIADLFECVVDHVADREALVCGDRRVTYAELDERSTRLAHALVDLGMAAGDHVGIDLYNGVPSVEAMLACFKARAAPVNVNWRYVADELAQLFDHADLRGVVHEPDLAGAVRDAAERVDSVRFLVDAGDGYEELVAGGSPDRDLGPRSGDDRYVLATGGTTGLPKAVVWRQEDIFFAVLGAGNPGGPPIARPEEIGERVLTNRALRLGPFLPPGDPGPEQFVQLALGPLMHASGNWSTLGTLLGGGKVVLYPDLHVDPHRVLELVDQERVVSLNLVGDASAVPLLDVIAASPGRYDRTSVRLIGSGGAMLAADVKRRLLDVFPNLLAITEAIGASEAPVQGISVTTRDGEIDPSLRFPTRLDATAVLDDDLHPIEPGSGRVGRLATRGRVPIGYHNDPERSAATFVEIDGARWSLPGDMATVEADGSIRLLGRGAACINTGGEKVYPEEVEAVLKSHPDVADARVVGVPDERWGHRVAAVVQPAHGGRPPSLDVLQDHCRAHLAGYKLPRVLRIVDVVVRSPAGKPDYAWAASEVER